MQPAVIGFRRDRFKSTPRRVETVAHLGKGDFAMANDAKLGLLAGLSAVLVIAVVYYQKLPADTSSGVVPASRIKSAPAAVDPIVFPPKPVKNPDVLLRAGTD